MPTNTQLQKLLDQYRAYVNPEAKAQLSMRTYGDVQDIIKNTASKIQQQATESAQKNIQALQASMGTAGNQYLNTMNQTAENLS
jgi:flagellar biosynthesis chaperone FliJ